MAYNSTLSTAQVLNAAIRDTNPATSSNYVLDQLSQTIAAIVNSTDQAVSVATQVSFDGGNTFAPMGTTANVPAGGTLICNQYDQTITALKLIAGIVRFVVTAASAPTAGSVTITVQGMLG